MNLSKRMIWIIITSASIVLIPSLLFFYKTAKQTLLDKELEQLQYQIQLVTEEFTSKINSGKLNLNKLDELINRNMPHADERDMERFDNKMIQFPDGAWRNNENRFNGNVEAGLFLAPDADITESSKRFYGEMLNIFNSFGATINGRNTFTNVWYIGHDRSEVIFDVVYPNFIYLMQADTDYRDTPWMTLTSPKENPERQTLWTPPLFDEVSQKWMVSAVHPLDLNGAWIGALGHDMQLEILFKVLDSISEKYAQDQHFLKDHRGGFILAGPWQKVLEQSYSSFQLPTSESHLTTLFNRRFSNQATIVPEVTMNGESYHGVALNLQPMNWTYVNLIPTEEIVAPLHHTLTQIVLMMIVMVLSMSLLISASIRHWVTKPIDTLVKRARAYTAGELVENTSVISSPELNELSVALDGLHENVRQESERLQFVSTHDDLTGLPNRTLLTDRLEHIIAFVKRHENKAAVLFIDLDEFKTINDSLGHSFGDKLLQMVSERLLFQLREEDTIARFGGDEFVVIISKFTHMLDVSNIAEKLLFVINQPYMIDGHDINVTGSIGISICPDDSDIAETLIQNADTAMYLSKGMGRNAYQFYTKAIHEKVVRKHQLEEALRRAIVENQFVLHYQAKVSLVTKQIYGMEALIRWQHPEFGMIPPDEFIALAEETGLIVEIGEWVIREACTAMKSWLTMYPWLDNISINLSVRQFKQEAFIANVLSILSDIDIDNRCIDFEITESIIMDDVEKAITILTDLRALGISISIDDFGTGYSSLNYLKRLPADTLKIDRTFVRDLSTDSADQAIIKSIIALATNLKLDVIAEGIEDRDQEALLTGMGCHAAQGYFYSKPISKEAMSELLMVQAEQME